MSNYAYNKKAKFDYEILKTIEAGLVLAGPEVKSIRNHGIKLSGAFVGFIGDEVFMKNLHIPKYKYDGRKYEYEPERERKLLLNKKEIAYLKGKSQEKGLTIIPISIYNRGRNIKIEIAIARGKKKYDKRETIKKRELKRELDRKMKEF